MKLNRKNLRRMILKEIADDFDMSKSPDSDKQVAAEMLKKIISDLQNVPSHNFDRYVQYLIQHQLPNVISMLES